MGLSVVLVGAGVLALEGLFVEVASLLGHFKQ